MYKLLSTIEIRGSRELYGKYADLFQVDEVPPNRASVLSMIHDYDGYISTLKFRADREFLDAAYKLKAIFTPSTGTDHIDVPYANEKGVSVFGMKNDREFLDNITATAEMALLLLLSVARNLPRAFDSVKSGQWEREKYKGHQLSGKTLGIIGFGRLGTIMAQYGRALRMNIIACDVKEITDKSVEQVSLDELLKRSDAISIHVHLDDSTTGLIGNDEFSKMKPGAFLVNTSRGAVIDENALLSALKNGQIAGAGLDVIDGEWMEDKTAHPLIQYAASHGNLIITPHLGGACFEAQAQSLDNTLQKAARFFRNDCSVSRDSVLIRSQIR